MVDAGIPRTTYRPMPADFPELFVLHGWDEIEAVTNAHKTTIKRWMLDYGEEELKARRRAHLEAIYGARGHKIPGVKPGQSRRSRYVQGRTLTAVIAGERKE